MTDEVQDGAAKPAREDILRCSFCGKSQHEVRKLIAGPVVFICDECVAQCSDLVREEHRAPETLDIAVSESSLETLELVQVISLRKLLRDGGLKRKLKGEQFTARELLEAIILGVRKETTRTKMTPERQALIRKAAKELDAVTKRTQREYDDEVRPLRRRLQSLNRGDSFDPQTGEIVELPHLEPRPEPVPGLETAILSKGEGIK